MGLGAPGAPNRGSTICCDMAKSLAFKAADRLIAAIFCPELEETQPHRVRWIDWVTKLNGCCGDTTPYNSIDSFWWGGH